MFAPLAVDAPESLRSDRYREVRARLESLLEGEDDWVAAMATVAGELHHAFAYFNWTGFYRVRVGPELPNVLVLERRSGWATKEMQGGASCARREEGAYRA